MIRKSVQAALLVLLAAGPAAAESDVSDGSERLTVTVEMTRAERDAGLAGKRSERRDRPLTTTRALDKDRTTAGSAQSGSGASAGSTQSGTATAQSLNVDFWFYDADVVLFNDFDGDGYFHGVDLLFDADTIYNYAEVYAVAYLSLDGGPWNEYAATDVFSISGTSADDEYVIVTELVSGYPAGSYDLLIELFDAVDDSFVASFGPVDTSALSFLTLEDRDRDTLVTGSTTVIVREGGGGSLGWPLLAIVLLAALPAVRRHWPAA